ncbi:Phage Tail Collar Domain protein [compost metagenome]
MVSGDNPTTLAGNGISDAYTKEQVDAIIARASALPVGAMVAFPVDKVAPGFLEVDGSVKSVAAYPDLAAFLGTTFNKGDEGVGNFRLPESRAEFFRGWDHGRGVDTGRAIGSLQAHKTEDHSHVTAVNDAGVSAPVIQNARGLGGAGAWPYGAEAIGVAGTNSISSNAVYAPSGEDSWLKTGPNIPLGSGETRPRNLAVMWCIKAWNAPINQGQIDIAALSYLAAQATESNQGTAKVASKEQMAAGTNDDTIVTPYKMRRGFSWSFTPNGYLAFPDWLFGLVLMWGSVAGVAASQRTIAFPFAFPRACLGISLTAYASQTTSAAEYGEQWVNAVSTTGAAVYTKANQTINYFAWGH